jgi:tRNA nucleotidyltransferase (CCA-adding enzyme)
MFLYEQILESLSLAGYEAYLVGGSVRDSILKRPSKDYDICTSATPEEIAALFEDVDLVGAHFGVCIVHEGDEQVEVATFRLDGAYSDNRRPDQVKYTLDVKEDLARRDFTINGLLMDKDGQVIDYVDGLTDIHTKTIRCIGDPKKRFHEDALRMLRAIRFEAQLDFRIEHKTQRDIINNAHLLSNISAERIRDEFNKALLCNASLAFSTLTCLGIFNHILKAFSKEVPNWNSPKLNEILGYLSREPKTKTITYYLSILLYSMLHDNKTIEEFLIEYKYPTTVIKTVLANIKALDLFPNAKKFTTAEMKRFVRQDNFNELIDLFIVFQPQLGSPLIKVLCSLIGWKDNELWPQPLLDGTDLIVAGYLPGPKFKEMLTLVETAQLNEEICSLEEALRLLDNNGYSRTSSNS